MLSSNKSLPLCVLDELWVTSYHFSAFQVEFKGNLGTIEISLSTMRQLYSNKYRNRTEHGSVFYLSQYKLGYLWSLDHIVKSFKTQ